MLKHFDCNDIGVVGDAELYPEMGVLVLTLSMCVGWLPADVTTVPPTDLSAASVCLLSQSVLKSDVLACGQTLTSDFALHTILQSYFVFPAVS